MRNRVLFDFNGSFREYACSGVKSIIGIWFLPFVVVLVELDIVFLWNFKKYSFC